MKRLRGINYRHYIFVGLLLIIIIPSFWWASGSYQRLGQSLLYLLRSFIGLFDFSKNSTVINPPNLSIDIHDLRLPADFQSAIYDFKVLSAALFNEDFAFLYLIKLTTVLLNLTRFLIWIPLIFIVIILVNQLIMRDEPKDKFKESKNLIKYKKIESRYIYPIKNWLNSVVNFWKDYPIYKIILAFVILIIYRAMAMGIDFVAWYFNFVKTFDFTSLWSILMSIIVDIVVVLMLYKKLPLIIIGIYLIFYLRRKAAENRLKEMQQINEDAVNELAVATLITGTVGSGKTMMMTSMAIDGEKLMRDKAFEVIQKHMHLFPNFPWYKFEKWIICSIENKSIINRAQMKVQIKERFESFLANENSPTSNLWDYDFKKYSLSFFNGIRMIYLDEALINYGQAYFLYYAPKALAFSNYATRFQFERNGHFPLYDYDYISFDKHDNPAANFSSIGNFDSRRILTKMNQFDSTKWYQMDGQIEAYTEIDKERGNKDDYAGMERTSDDANQRNDGFNRSIKITRHEFTIDGYPFTKLLFDSQREYSVNADLRETCEDRIRIKKKTDIKVILPLFWIDYLLCEPLIKAFDKYYFKFRSKRTDRTLYNYLLEKLIKPFYDHFTKNVNLFGYQSVNYRHEIGATADESGEKFDKIYYFIFQKMYADRYRTDCYSTFFDDQRLKAKSGFYQAKTYSSTMASVEELTNQDSYWIEELKKYTEDNNVKSKIEYKEDE
ncbi:hypothetical protein [Trichlorobacter sp.]|uniref:hypothetical protein n=1 Tax=Trichlorobacter sp. TaxID=2911007 RepID=UPI002A3657F6|nr:hypothetical protein [Trichlorobacter sp.]MDY0385477.1 hypothetical protein [Trichlorobacter sp.]